MGAVLKLLSNKGFIQYNKIVAKNLGVKEAIVLGELCSLSDYYKTEELYVLQDKLAEETALSVRQVRSAILTLEENGVLRTVKKGNPCRNYYVLSEKEILKFFTDEPKEKKEGQKKEPLINREPVNDIEKVEKEYLLNYQKLFEQGILFSEKPVINWSASRRMTKESIEKYGLQTILFAIKNSLSNKFCLSTGYVLTTILSAGVLAQLINTRNTRGIANDQLSGTETIDF